VANEAKKILAAESAANLVTPRSTIQDADRETVAVPPGRVWKFRNVTDNDVAYRLRDGYRTLALGQTVETTDQRLAEALAPLVREGKVELVEDEK
jgi:hypothetical protein